MMNIKGLVLCGGHSKRMGKDKGRIEYFNRPQVEHVYDLLDSFCSETFVSIREDQANMSHLENMKKIIDVEKNLGPLGGLYSAFALYPDDAWLVMACDMPFVKESDLNFLISKRNIEKKATCFYNEEKNWPEPLCTIWEPGILKEIEEAKTRGKLCPRKILMNTDAEFIVPLNVNCIKNINSVEDLNGLDGLYIL